MDVEKKEGKKVKEVKAAGGTEEILSHATDFSSIFSGSVNPRTGMYSFTVNLLSCSANNLSGPEIDLSLNYNPNFQGDHDIGPGFGPGKTMMPNLTTLDIDNHTLYLSSGEAVKLKFE